MKKVGFIGCGIMGKPMAANLLKVGYSVITHDLNLAQVRELEKLGAGSAGSPGDIASQKPDIIITMLPSSPDVEQVLCGDQGVFETVQKGTLIIDMTTGDPLVSQRLASMAAEKGIDMLDAPVSGGEIGAIEGTLTIMVGGKREVFERGTEVLRAMGKNIVYAGESGMGATVKLCNQMAFGINILGLAESIIFGARLGVKPEVQFQVLSNGSGRSFVQEKYYPVPGLVPNSPADRDFAPGFMTSLLSKDLGLVMSTANELKMPLATCSLAHQLYEAACANGLGKKDCTSVINFLRQLTGEQTVNL
ncbi:MAG: 3-hydroxyisobutyrate dehydrogenase [Dehalococcoidales bacterium]